MELAGPMLDTGARVVDLSGTFRLRTPENYTAWYKEPHTRPDLLAEAVYGLPEFCRAGIPAARLVANPGCYPTAANLAIRPLIEAGVVDRAAGIVCDAKSGVSGAGRKPRLSSSFCEVTENFSAYSVLRHRHVPEVLQVSGLEDREFSFTAQLLPLDRGILETIYFRATGVTSAEDLVRIYETRYAGEPFVRIYQPGHFPDLHAVAHTNFCDLGVTFDAAQRPRRGGQRHRQPGERRGRAGHPEHEPDAGVSRDRGAAMKVLVKLGGTLLDRGGIARFAGRATGAAPARAVWNWWWSTAAASR